MKQLARLLPSVLREVASDPEVALLFLRELWPHIVGEDLARRSSPVSLVQGCLGLTVSDPAWQRELPAMSRLMIRSVNSFWGFKLVERIDFRLD